MTTEHLQVVLVTDATLLRPTLFTMWGLLRHTSAPLTLHFWGDGLAPKHWQAVEQVAASTPAAAGAPICHLTQRQITAEELAGASTGAAHISAATMGRLFIPRHLSGRVLYLDGDVAVTGDVAPLIRADLGGYPLGAVRDFMTARRASQTGPDSPEARYFNAGVLLMDCDALRARPEGLAPLEDVVRASSLPMGDQDHLNTLYPGEAQLLNPAYNSSWGRTAAQRSYSARLAGDAAECAPIKDVIVHFHGPKKPWKKPRYDLWSPRARAVLRYRRALRRFNRQFPDLAF